ncbi:MAG: IS630 family transposase [Flavobacteriales bacterium]|nr:IS630 family transposase [Flavobacteriales bacterium]
MKADKLYEQRKAAIHLLRSGLSKPEVASRLHRSREWVYKWWSRYNKNKGFTDLRNHSSAPKHIPGKISEEIRREIKIARSELEAEKAEGKTKVHIGVESVRERLKIKGVKKIPSEKSIERILKDSGMSQKHRSEDKPIKAKLQKAKVQATTESTESSNRRANANPQQRSERNANTSQINSRKQNPSWVLKLLQGKVGLDELNKGLSGELNQKEIQKLLMCVLNNPLRQRNRAVIILAYLHGIPKSKISSSLLVSRGCIDKCIKRFALKGVEESLNPSWNITKKLDDPKYKDTVFKVLHAPPSSYGINRTTWRMEDIKSVMAKQGLDLSIGNIRKIIKDEGYRFRKAKKVLTSNDPDYLEKIQHIKNILSNLGAKEKFFSIDEYGPISIKLQGGKSLMPPGVTKTIPQFQKSKGSLIVTGGLELSTNQVTHFYSDKKDTEEMLRLLEILLKKYKGNDCIYLSWDAASWHCSKEFKDRVEEVNRRKYRKIHGTPLVKLAPLPAGAQFLNVIESVFSGMAKAIIHNSDYESVKECKKAITKYFSERNKKFKKNPKRAGNKIWGKEIVKPQFSESNNCKDPNYR